MGDIVIKAANRRRYWWWWLCHGGVSVTCQTAAGCAGKDSTETQKLMIKRVARIWAYRATLSRRRLYGCFLCRPLISHHIGNFWYWAYNTFFVILVNINIHWLSRRILLVGLPGFCRFWAQLRVPQLPLCSDCSRVRASPILYVILSLELPRKTLHAAGNGHIGQAGALVTTSQSSPNI